MPILWLWFLADSGLTEKAFAWACTECHWAFCVLGVMA